MAVESSADRLVFLNPDEFGVTGTYTPQSGSPRSIAGIFDEAYFAVELGAGVPIEGARPRFLCRTEDLPSPPKHGDALTVPAGSYLVREIHDDGTGMTELVIEKQ